jgi:hypothetical protein
MHCAKVLDTFSPLENFPIVLIINFACMNTLCTTLSRLDYILMLFVRHVDCVCEIQSKKSDAVEKRCRPDDDQTHTNNIIYIRLAAVLRPPRKIRPACLSWNLG